MLLPFLCSLYFSFFLLSTAQIIDVRSPQSSSILKRASNDCVNPDPDNTLTDRMNLALNSSGAGFVLSLCPSTTYVILAPIKFAAPNQEISTVGYPTGDERATLVVFGPVFNGTGHSTAVDGTCANCDGVKLRNVQINGTRNGAPPLNGGANIEMGGANSGQLIEYVRSFDPRSWSCLHIVEGGLKCNNVTVQNNDIGPCGTDTFSQWADGISFSCKNGIVRNNLVNNPTDGGIVLFGSPGTLVENNTIWIGANTLLGGINLVDYAPFNGNYTGVIVQNNIIAGGFATDKPANKSDTKGDDQYDAIVKIGIAIGPRTWFGNKYGNNVSVGAIIRNNQLTGAFGYGIAMSSAKNFTVQGNTLVGNTAFIGSRGPNCTKDDSTPSSQPFVIDQSTVTSSTTQTDLTPISDGDALTCIVPPSDGDYWPFGGNPENPNTPPVSPPESSSSSGGSNVGRKVGLAIGIIAGVAFVGVLAWFIRRWALARQQSRFQTGYGFEKRAGFVRREF